MEYYIGIDVGTTNIKAAAYTLAGAERAFFSVSSRVHNPRKEWSEFLPEEIWGGVCACLHSIIKTVSPSEIKAVGVSSMAEAGVPLDESGRALYPIIAWYDQRSQPEAAALAERIPARRLFSLTGQIPSEKYGVTKLMWIKRNHPEAYERTKHWLSVEDYILFRLTGELATDYSVAARTMLFDVNRLCWSKEIAEAAGLDAGMFPPAYPGGTPVGRLTGAAAAETGLSRETLAVTGGHDHACASVGVDIQRDGVVLDSMGTAECSMVAMETPPPDDAAFSAYYSIYAHCGKKTYRALSSLQACGASIDWYFETLGRDVALLRDKYLIMESAAALSRRDGLYFMPFLRGSVENKNMRGVFIGLRDTHRPGDMARAIMDSLCYELHSQISGYEGALSQKLGTLRVVGGLADSEYFMQTKASVTRMVVEVPARSQAACFGAAVLAAIGSGAVGFGDIPSLYHPKRVYEPRGDAAAIKADYERYLTLRERVKEIYRQYY